MTEKQQTAIQWLIEQIMADKTSAWKKEIEQALEMEREQIIIGYLNGQLNGYTVLIEKGDIQTPDEYFTEIYQSNK